MKNFKNLLLVLVAVLSFSSMSSQWKTNYYVDDFGEKTKDSYESFTTQGTFSNSATTNGDAEYLLIKTDKSITINVYEYKSHLASDIKATFETVKVKTPSGVVKIESVFFTKDGRLYFSKENYVTFEKAISGPGDYIMVFKRSSSYSSSSYKAKFTIK